MCNLYSQPRLITAEDPKVYISNLVVQSGEEIAKKVIEADCLSAWGLCLAGVKPPEAFGTAMAEACRFLGYEKFKSIMPASGKSYAKKKVS